MCWEANKRHAIKPVSIAGNWILILLGTLGAVVSGNLLLLAHKSDKCASLPNSTFSDATLVA